MGVYKKSNADDEFLERLIHCSKELVASREFSTSLEDVDNALEWYEEVCRPYFKEDREGFAKLSIAYSELYMNAYEHGNLQIDAKEKQSYLQEDIYFDKLQELEKKRSGKKIEVKIYLCNETSTRYLVTQICDDGEGFDLQAVNQLHKNSNNFNGRGIFISNKNTLAIYYNPKGNCVVFFKELKENK